jgi:hypothetical protein
MTIAVSGRRSEIAPAAGDPAARHVDVEEADGRPLREGHARLRIRARRLAAHVEAVLLENGADPSPCRRVDRRR